jgi:DNA-binding winged helix-turn-helix (wHTH) protein
VRVGFGECVFDSGTRELRRGGQIVHVSPKAFQLLEVLLQHRPRVLSKAEIHETLGPKTFVSVSSVGRLIVEIRAAIGDSARTPALVRTVHGFGYAFSGAVTDLDAPAPAAAAASMPGSAAGAPGIVYRLVWRAREIELAPGATILGRERGCAVWLDAPGVSRRHARIEVSGDRAVLEDLGSKNGTYLRGQRIAAPTPLADGDPIALGTALLTVRALRGGGSTETVPTPANSS